MNGDMQILSYHLYDAGAVGPGHRGTGGNQAFGGNLVGFSAVEAARIYLDLLVVDGGLGLTPMDPGSEMEFTMVDTMPWPTSGTYSVKFRQSLHRVPIYGSSVTVEVDGGNDLICLNGAVASPIDISPKPTLLPGQAIAIACSRSSDARCGERDEPPRLYYYQDEAIDRWRLVFKVDGVEISLDEGTDLHVTGTAPDEGPGFQVAPLQVCDVLVDAHSGEVAVELPRNHFCLSNDPDYRIGVDCANDELGCIREFTFVEEGVVRKLIDPIYNVCTHDFDYQSIVTQVQLLPGVTVTLPPSPWNPRAVGAHANAVQVAAFLKDVLKRDGLDRRGREFVVTFNCRHRNNSEEWCNAAWLGSRGQVVFGQTSGLVKDRMENQSQTETGESTSAKSLSFASALDLMAHEIFHGVNHHTARLENLGMSGALNESYADIFAVIIANTRLNEVRPKPIREWEWRIGAGIGLNVRSMREPGKFDVVVDGIRYWQPEHMKDYVRLPIRPVTDWGGVHINSGIHNKAAYNLLTSADLHGCDLFDGELAARIFYKAFVDGIYERATFSASRIRILNAAKTLLLHDHRSEERLTAIASAFDAVGIE